MIIVGPNRALDMVLQFIVIAGLKFLQSKNQKEEKKETGIFGRFVFSRYICYTFGIFRKWL